MRIVFLSHAFPVPFAVDRGTYNLEVCRALAAGHEVRAVVPVPWVDELGARLRRRRLPAASRQDTISGVPVAYPRYYYTPRVGRRFYGPFLWHSIRRSLHAAAAFRPDVVLGYWAHPDGYAAVRLARSVGARACLIVGGSDVLLLAQRGMRRRLILDVLRSADAVLPVSEHLCARLAEMGIARERLFAFRRGVDLGRFCPGPRDAARLRLRLAPESRIVLWVGRMVPVKGLSVLLDACERLRGEPGLRVLLAGSGPLGEGLAARVAEAGLGDVVGFLGSLPHAALPDWFRAADAVVLPSFSEGVPNVLQEAHACGTPFVASDVGGIPEVACAGVDRLVPAGDAAALAAALRDVLRSPRPDPVALAAAVPSLEAANARLLAVLRGSAA